MLPKEQYKDFIRLQATAAGFTGVGFAKAEALYEDAQRLEKWLKKDYQGKMSYMENHFDLRIDPTKLVPGAKSVISLLYNYYTGTKQENGKYKISQYAFGEDYHQVIRKKLSELITVLEVKIGSIRGRGFVDSAPVLERSWAVRSGLGWVGKNGNLISRNKGSFFFIATLITDLELEPDHAFTPDYCGTCTKCIDHCPTEAILPNKEIDGSKCISYFTIELKDALLPESFKGKMEHWIFGCDTCQDVCPWNRFAKQNQEPAWKPVSEILHFSDSDWEQLTREQFRKIFRNSAIKRTKYEGLIRNIRFLQV